MDFDLDCGVRMQRSQVHRRRAEISTHVMKNVPPVRPMTHWPVHNFPSVHACALRHRLCPAFSDFIDNRRDAIMCRDRLVVMCAPLEAGIALDSLVYGRGYLEGRARAFQRGSVPLGQVTGAIGLARRHGVPDEDIAAVLKEYGLAWDPKDGTLTRNDPS
jgi:hypothetical protein